MQDLGLQTEPAFLVSSHAYYLTKSVMTGDIFGCLGVLDGNLNGHAVEESDRYSQLAADFSDEANQSCCLLQCFLGRDLALNSCELRLHSHDRNT